MTTQKYFCFDIMQAITCNYYFRFNLTDEVIFETAALDCDDSMDEAAVIKHYDETEKQNFRLDYDTFRKLITNPSPS